MQSGVPHRSAKPSFRQKHDLLTRLIKAELSQSLVPHPARLASLLSDDILWISKTNQIHVNVTTITHFTEIKHLKISASCDNNNYQIYRHNYEKNI
jgi:hypothetical protein